MYFLNLCAMPENFQMQQQKNENMVQSIHIFPNWMLFHHSKAVLKLGIKYFSAMLYDQYMNTKLLFPGYYISIL